MFLRCTKPRPDNKTGIPGIHKFVYKPRVPGSKKIQIFPDKWTVQFKCCHVCICYSFTEAVLRRYEEEVEEGMYADNPSKSLAYQYLEKEGLINKLKINEINLLGTVDLCVF
jgi:hypothetical protein